MPTLVQTRPPSRVRGKPTEDGEFVVFEHVAVFDEHEGSDGVVYDQALLEAIAANNNRRIRDTGDWCPVVVAHTRDQEDKVHVNDDPPVIGLAGPFYVSTLGEENPRACIFCSFWIFRENEKDFLRNPRRSVEIWPEERPEDRYFDPIAVLGAEAPKRDLGMIYSRRGLGNPIRYCTRGPLRYSKRSIQKKLRYQEAPVSAPGGNNTFIPGAIRKPQRNQQGDSTMLSPDELQQIAEAMKPMIQAAVDQATAAVDSSEPVELPGDDMGMEPGGEMGEELGGDIAPEPMDDAPIGDPAAEAPPSPADFGGEELLPEDDDMGGEEDTLDLDEDDQMYAKGLGRKFGKYMRDGDFDDDGADQYMASLDDDDKSILNKYMRYMCSDDDTKTRYSERYLKAAPGVGAGLLGADMKNSKSPIGGDDITDKPGDSTPSGAMCGDEMSSGKATKYAKDGNVDRYKKERDDAVQKYRKLNQEHVSLKQKYAKQQEDLNSMRTKERYSRRLAAFIELQSEGYVLDPEDEMELTEDYSDEQFTRHTTRTIPERYSRVSGDTIPIGDQNPATPTKRGADKYAKKAREATEKYRKSGRNVPFRQVLEHMIENDGEVDESKLLLHAGNGKA